MDARAAAELKTTLRGITLPAGKSALLEHAVQQRAEPALLDALQSLSEREFESLDDVVEEILRVQPPSNLSEPAEPHDESGQPPGGETDYVTVQPLDTGRVRDLKD